MNALLAGRTPEELAEALVRRTTFDGMPLHQFDHLKSLIAQGIREDREAQAAANTDYHLTEAQSSLLRQLFTAAGAITVWGAQITTARKLKSLGLATITESGLPGRTVAITGKGRQVFA